MWRPRLPSLPFAGVGGGGAGCGEPAGLTGFCLSRQLERVGFGWGFFVFASVAVSGFLASPASNLGSPKQRETWGTHHRTLLWVLKSLVCLSLLLLESPYA